MTEKTKTMFGNKTSGIDPVTGRCGGDMVRRNSAPLSFL